MATEPVIDIQEMSYHRNGISGHGFHVVRFAHNPDDSPKKSKENFMAILFEEEGNCAVIGLDRIASMGVKFAGGNSWRGDYFELVLRKAINER